MARNLFAALAGALFGIGLWMSGMTETARVQGWLDVFGAWDPTLAFVLGGALLPMAIAWRVAAGRSAALLGTSLPEAPGPRVGHNLVLGSLMFGAGWGLVGLCPGPAMASLGWGGWQGGVFLLAMIVGMVAAPPIRARIDRMAEA